MAAINHCETAEGVARICRAAVDAQCYCDKCDPPASPASKAEILSALKDFQAKKINYSEYMARIARIGQ